MSWPVPGESETYFVFEVTYAGDTAHRRNQFLGVETVGVRAKNMQEAKEKLQAQTAARYAVAGLGGVYRSWEFLDEFPCEGDARVAFNFKRLPQRAYL